MKVRLMKTMVRVLPVVLVATLICACGKGSPAAQVAEDAPIYPDYTDVTVPANIAPMNFGIRGAEAVRSVWKLDGKELLKAEGEDYVSLSEGDWRKLMNDAKGRDIEVTVSVWNDKYPQGATYKPFRIHVAEEDVDNWLAYRLIPPGYENWNHMGIYERNLTSFEVKTLIENNQNNKGCVNCHQFAGWSPDNMMFHARGKGGGTVVVTDGVPKKVVMAALSGGRSGTYPAFHPSGRFIAFSNNRTHQVFYARSRDKVEVYDAKSDLMFYDVRKGQVLTDERFNDSISWETFPAFSPDGCSLYFCTAHSVDMPVEYEKLHYSICRVAFNEQDGSLGEQVDTVYSASSLGGSCSFPRISPDGRYLLFTLADCATFPIHHKEADLKMLDLQTNEPVDVSVLNSPDVDSYHSWSSNGHWVVLSSKRQDGQFTKLYLSYFNDGKFTKPFLLPQKNPYQNDRILYSYNIPEFITKPAEFGKNELAKLFKAE